MSRQTEFTFRTWGGARKGAGRKRASAKPSVSHLRRPSLQASHPVLVTMRVRRDVPNLRTQQPMTGVRLAFAGGRRRFGFRLVHFSVQGNHLHLIVEAADRRALSRGMQGLAIRLARRVNGAIGRSGSMFADRYHARALGSPREVRNALAYVLLNRQRHGGGIRVQFAEGELDPCSSGAVFDGWARGFRAKDDAAGGTELTVAPRSWLLATGWRRRGLLDPREVPGPRFVR
jgi:REP element-mobilizing transposase RayT